ncbi:hypothetical protein K440DRAFT_646247 [Wilcoxina mikolae CBS 423.85]|nr:hypothetical protein K440DRAFT_646247 [Wilcoxina mikolae CBS 423.85]
MDSEWCIYLQFSDPAKHEGRRGGAGAADHGSSGRRWHKPWKFLDVVELSTVNRDTSVLSNFNRSDMFMENRLDSLQKRSLTGQKSVVNRKQKEISSDQGNLILNYKPLEFPLCAVKKRDLTSPRLSEGSSLRLESSRRKVSDFFVAEIWRTNIEMEVKKSFERNHRIAISAHSRLSTPPPTAGMVLKFYTPDFLVDAYNEANTIGVGLLLEKVEGDTLLSCLKSNPGLDRCRTMFLLCWHALEKLHDADRSHGDVTGHNIIFVTENDVVFIDFEYSQPADDRTMMYDQIGLRIVFREFGCSDDQLKEWAN